VANVAAATDSAGARLLHVSSDYVFDGTAREPYKEDAATAPLSAYGRSKLLGERHALAYPKGLAVRTSWLFGPGGPNFAATMASMIRQGKLPLRVVDDQVGRPTYTRFLARALVDLAALPVTGVLHYGNREPVSWYAFATEIARQLGGAVEVIPVTTAEFPRPAPRPAWSVLDVTRFEEIAGRPVEPWNRGLADLLARMRTERNQ
jgi:dTDP-4-dehydrorhamnose reductase